MKVSDGFSKLKPSVLMVIFNILSTIFLALAVKDLPISVAYPIWTGIGAMGTVVIGILAFNESKSFKKYFFLTIILLGIIGLKVV
jgi:quaternary ammonium compound-resistance protein SugE